MRKDKDQRRFVVTSLTFFLTVAAIVYAPVFGGRVPIPAGLITSFPAWETASPNNAAISPGVDNGDLITLFYPWRVLTDRSIRAYEIPLWNPHVLGGTPLIASAQAAVFYPIHILLFTLPVPAAWSLKLLLNVVVAGFLTSMFVRSLGAETNGALAAGMIYALCGFITGWQGQAITDAAIWLPLVCWSAHEIYRRPSALWAVIGAFAFALPVLAGHPETAAHVTLVGVLFFLWQIVTDGWSPETMRRRLGWFSVAGLLALGISAVQSLPTVEWLGHLNHSLEIQWGALKPTELLAFFSRDLSKTPNSSNIHIPESTAYAGITTLILAAFALLRLNKRYVFFFVLLTFFALTVAIGLGPANWLVLHSPILQGIKNWRLLGVADFSLAVLVGLGLSAIAEGRALVNRHVWLTFGTIFSATSLGLWSLHAHLIARPSPWRGPASAVVFLGIAASIILLKLTGRIAGRTFGTLALLLLSLDMVSYAFGYLSFVRPDKIFPAAPLFSYLQQHDPHTNRVVNLNAYPLNAETVYGIEGVTGWDVTLKLPKRLLIDYAAPTLDAIAFRSANTVLRNDRRLDLMNARYFVANKFDPDHDLAAADPQRFRLVFSEGAVQVFENLRSMPRAWFVPAKPGAIEIIPSNAKQLNRLRDSTFDPEKTVLLNALPNEAGGEALPETLVTVSSSVTQVDRDTNSQTWRVDATQPGIMVLSQIFYPGWFAYVDGTPTSVLRADYAITGVFIPAGTHTVRFQFHPASVRVGAAVTVVSIVLSVGMLIIGRMNARSPIALPVEGGTVLTARPGSIAAIAGVLLAAIIGLAIYKNRPFKFDPANPPQLVLSTSEVRAGLDSYVLAIDAMPNASVTIRYSIDEEPPAEFSVRLDSDGTYTFPVGADTRKGLYRMLQFKEKNTGTWFPANSSIVVK